MSIFTIFPGRGGPSEYGRHIDIQTGKKTYIPMEQTWMEYKQNSN